MSPKKPNVDTGKKVFPARVMCFIFCCSVLLISGSTAMGKQPRVWKVDYRDLFYDIAFLNNEKAVIVGAMGRIIKTHEKYKNLWEVRDSGTIERLTCLNFIDDKNGWAAGYGGIILHTADGGRTWETQRASSKSCQPLFDIQFVNRNVGYASGNFELLLKTADGGKTWKDLSLNVDEMFDAGLLNLYFSDEHTGYVVGEFGGIAKTLDGGITWKWIDQGGYDGTFFGIITLSPDIILVHGISGTILRSDDGGQTWETLPRITRQRLFRSAWDGKTLVIIGSTGAILVSKDQGKTFSRLSHDHNTTSFAGVCVNPSGGFFCVGERGTILPINP